MDNVIIITGEEREIFRNLLIKPKKPELTLEIYNEIEKEALSELKPFKEECHRILDRLRELEDIDEVAEYIKLQNQYKEIKEKTSPKIHECDKKRYNLLKQYKCPHPIYAAKGNHALCVLCREPHEWSRSTHYSPELWQKLIDEKKLIAGITHYINKREWPDPLYIPEEIIPFDEIVNFYQKLYDSKEKLDRCGIINENHSLEDLLWEHYDNTPKQMVKQLKK